MSRVQDDLDSPSLSDSRAPVASELRTLFEVSQDLICLAGTDGYFRWLNPVWSTVLGWSLDEMYARPFVELVHPADVEATFAEVTRLSEGRPAVNFENRYKCKDGSWRWLSWNSTPRPDGSLFCVVRDVTALHEERRETERRVRQLELAESLLKVGNWRVDLKTGTPHWSPEVYRIHGRDPETYMPNIETAIEAYHRADRDEVRRKLDQAIAERGGFSFQLRLIRADTGEQRIVRSSGMVATDDEGEPSEIIGVFQDITELTRSEQELRRANETLERRMAELEERSAMMTAMSELGDMLQSAIDLEESKEVLRALLPRIFHEVSGVVYLRDVESGDQTRAASWGGLDGGWRTAEPGSCWAVRRGTTHTVRRDGVLRCRHLAGVPGGSRCVPMMAHGQLVGLLVLTAATEREEQSLEGLGGFAATVADQIALAVSNVRLRDRLRQQSLRDQLTGLYNRRFLDDWLAKQLSQAARSKGSVGVAMLDLDHFKRFNDTFGHLAADRLLSAFADVLQTTMRSEDVVCRWGGEEFLVAMPGASASEVQTALHRIQEGLACVEVRDDDGVRVSPPTLSAGVATFPDNATGRESLLFQADKALYDAKSSGRNRVVVAGERVRAGTAA